MVIRIIRLNIFIFFIPLFSCSNVIEVDNRTKYWTVIMYLSADCNLESYLLQDVEEVKVGTNNSVNIIVLIDRSPNYSTNSSVFGENFSDTRLYRILKRRVVRISGEDEFPEITLTSQYEANTGDPQNLKKLIRFCKKYYPAKNYALFFGGHGDGVRSGNESANHIYNRAISVDDTDFDDNGEYDLLYMAEITDCFDYEENIDLLIFDACMMGTIETAYQFRLGNNSLNAKYIVN